jgi:hypothetical protein
MYLSPDWEEESDGGEASEADGGIAALRAPARAMAVALTSAAKEDLVLAHQAKELASRLESAQRESAAAQAAAAAAQGRIAVLERAWTTAQGVSRSFVVCLCPVLRLEAPVCRIWPARMWPLLQPCCTAVARHWA